MDGIASTAYNALERMLLDENEEPRPLPLSLLETITNNFSVEMELGRGGFAVVYKGELGSRMVAVKKLSGSMDMDEKQFIKEIECLMKVRHKNIVRFLGYCAETQGLLQDFGGKSVLADVRNRALCFEYVPEGALDKHITDASRGLEWKVRYKIIKGICEGLHYLHRSHILHLDLKPANILLDDNMVPKIADFGLSRRLDQTQSTVIGTTVMGSFGYFPPECHDRKFSYKSDVYSLGVVIMEILTGERFPTAEEVLESWRNRLEISQEYIPLEHVKACAEIGTMCTNHSAAKRPTTQHILEILKDMDGTNEFNEPGESASSEAQMDAEGSTGYDVLERMLLDESEEPKQLPLSFLEAITNNFSNEREHGRGGIAVVYKGVIGTTGTIAVKKLYRTIDIDEKQFNNTVQLLMKARHKNILRFLGYCAHKNGAAADSGGNSIMADVQNRTLCFEYLPNGSLSNYITDASRGPEWSVRYQIIKGICEGLHYLHEKSILHLDLEPANILIGDNMVPKIADFGLSRCLDQNQRNSMPTILMRKIGYWAPEVSTRQVTFKSDIYSLGVVIMEILTGERRYSTDEEVLKGWRTQLSQQDVQEVETCARIGMKCMDTNPANRPTTQDIMKMLIIKENISAGKQQENTLIACVGKNLGYCAGNPVAAYTIYKCLLHWKSFQRDKTGIFDRLIQLIGSEIENEEDNDNLAYWLSNISTLIFLLQNIIEAADAPVSGSRIFGRSRKGRALRYGVEAKYHAMLFKQQLTPYAEKIYGIIRDNTKKKLSYFISLCIQAPSTMEASMLRVSGRLSGQSQSNPWHKIIEGLDNQLTILQDNHVPPIFAQKIFLQIFSYINVQLFNSLLLHREGCSFGNAEYVKVGLAELEVWCAKATEEYAAFSWEELIHIRQAVGFLVVIEKFGISFHELVNDLCPILTIQQLHRICTQYWDDKYNTQGVSSDVLSNMEALMAEDSYNVAGTSILLDDDSSLPFLMDDITDSMKQKDFSDVKPPEELLEDPAFQFLQNY